MQNILRASPRLAMIIEVNPKALHAAGSSPKSLLSLLESYEFVARLILPNGRLASLENKSFEGSTNLLCLRTPLWEELMIGHVDPSSQNQPVGLT